MRVPCLDTHRLSTCAVAPRSSRHVRAASEHGSGRRRSSEVRVTRKKRKSVSTGTRFKVFQRDNFMCRYCGKRPPEVKLVIDHMTPVASGADHVNDPENLVTSCDRCNAGKGARMLDEEMIPSITEEAEAALKESLYRQRNMLELHQQAKRIREQVRWEIKSVWTDAFLGDREMLDDGRETITSPHVPWPSDGTIDSWTEQFGMDMTIKAVWVTSEQVCANHVARSAATRYTWGVLKRMADDLRSDRER